MNCNDASCHPEASAAAAAAAAAAQYPDDPTLDACCQRDLEQQRRVAVVKAKLLAYDRVDRRLRVARQAVGVAPDAAVEEKDDDDEEEEEPGSRDSWEDSDEDDEVVQAMKQKRMEEMQKMMRQVQVAPHLQAGLLIDVPCNYLLKRIEETKGNCVCHLSVEGYEPSAQLDEHLDRLAHHNRGTAFLRANVPKKSALKEAFGIAFLPALLSFKDGCVVGRAPLTQFGNMSVILEEQVTSYLQRLRVLKSTPKVADGDETEADSSEGEEEC